MKIGIINFKMGNINSVKNAIEYLGCKIEIINDRKQIKDDFTYDFARSWGLQRCDE